MSTGSPPERSRHADPGGGGPRPSRRTRTEGHPAVHESPTVQERTTILFAGDPAVTGPTPAASTATAPTSVERSDRGLLRTTGSLALPTLISRVTGFAKVAVLAYVLGLEALSSAFNLANTLPNIISELVLGAVLTSIVIPVLVRAEREDADRGVAFTRRLFTVAGLILVVATVASVAGAGLLTALYQGADSKISATLVTHLAVLLLPQILFYGFSALTGAVLNTRGVYGLVAWAPVLNNVVALATLVVYALTPGELAASFTNAPLLVLGVGTTLGIVAQAVVVVPELRRQGVSLRPLWGLDPRLKQFGAMAVAVVAYVLVAQVGLTVTYRVANSSSEGAVTLYNNAWLLLQVPYGVLGVSLLTAIMPRMSRAAAAGDDRAVVADLSLGSRLSVLALAPILVLFTVHGSTLGVALFGYGAADADSASMLGVTVAASAFGLLPYAVVLLQLRVFYARQQAWVPTLVMLVMVTVRVPLMLLAPVLLPADDVVLALAFVNGLGFAVGAVLGAVLLRRELGPLDLGSLVRTAAWVLGASLLGVALDLVVSALVPLGRLGALGGLGSVVEMAVHSVLVLGVAVAVLLRSPLSELDAFRPPATRLLGRVGLAALVAPARRRSETPYPEPVTQGGRGEGTGRGDVTGADDRAPLPPGVREDVPAEPTGRAPGGPTPSSAPRPPVRGPRLVPGAAVAGGRYRLLVAHGGSGPLRFWQARDTTLDRDVALTFVDAEQSAPPGVPASANQGTSDEGDPQRGPQAVLTRTRRLGGLDSPGLARVLDVVRGSSGGIVVSEWTNGRSLREVAETSPSPVGAARAVSALAAAAEAAHRAGTFLALDHPDRVRISSAGTAILAFPGVSDDADQQGDVRGLGAVLYGLVTAHWPLSPDDGEAELDGGSGDGYGEPTVGGMPLAPRTASGAAVEPRRLRPSVPFEVSTVTSRALQPDAGLRTAAAVETVLNQAAVLDQQTDMFPAITDDTPRPARATSRSGGSRRAVGATSAAATAAAAPRDADPGDDLDGDGAAAPRDHRARNLSLSLVALGVVVVLVGALFFSQLQTLFGGGSGSSRLPALQLGPDGSVISTTSAPAASGDPAAPAPAAAPAAAPTVTGATVYSPGGKADHPNDVGLAIDGNPATVWPTDQYRQPMGSLKAGVGVLLSLQQPGPLSSVTVVSPSPGTVVEIRSTPSADPSFAETVLVGTATLTESSTTIPVTLAAPTQHVLVWITTLSTASGSNQSDIGEITLAS